jgi:hypothetical protein
MIQKSQDEGSEERKIYAKFKCFCDKSEAEKTESLEDLSNQISILESKIEELQGSNGEKSSSSFEYKTRIAAITAAVDEAKTIRDKENKAFKAEKADLEQAIQQMKEAVLTLGAVGADQTDSQGTDFQKFMGGHKPSLLKVSSALAAAQPFMNDRQYRSVTAFIQGPFTGSYTSQSAEVLGILKSMRDTFKSNLKASIKTESEQLKQFDALMEVKAEEKSKLISLLKEAQATLGSNDEDLSSKRKQLAAAEKAKSEDEDFMDKLIPMCKEKTEEYNKRKLLRANEESAISQAISILNSDAAFDTFGSVDATSTGKLGFIQLSSVRRHIPDQDVRSVMQRLLRRAATEQHHKGRATRRLNRVMSLLHTGNPFDEVLEEIDKMIEVIDEEGKADAEKLDFCKTERKENKKALAKQKADISRLESQVDELEKTIDDPVTGLIAQIANVEKSLLENEESQKTETADRKESNVAYQKDVKNLVAAESILDNAIGVLKAYYDKFDAAFLQQQGVSLAQEDPAPPETWGKYKGQSKGGGDAVTMLEFILAETQKEEAEAHAAEEKAQVFLAE